MRLKENGSVRHPRAFEIVEALRNVHEVECLTPYSWERAREVIIAAVKNANAAGDWLSDNASLVSAIGNSRDILYNARRDALKTGLLRCKRTYAGKQRLADRLSVDFDRLVKLIEVSGTTPSKLPDAEPTSAPAARAAVDDVKWSPFQPPQHWERFSGLSWKTIKRRISSGSLHAEKKHGQAWRFPMAEVEKLAKPK